MSDKARRVAAGIAAAVLTLAPAGLAVAQTESTGGSSDQSAGPVGADEGEADVSPGSALDDGGESAAEPSPGEAAEGEESGADADKKKGEKGEDAKSDEAKGGDVPALPDSPKVTDKLGDQRAKALKRFRKVYERYGRELRDYQKTVNSIVDAEYKRRKAELTSGYNETMDKLEASERRRRQKAIERFKKFLERHPDQPRYTPDALFRLAELYFELENDQYLLADEKYRRQMKLYRKGRRPDPPDPPTKDYSKTISAFERLVSNWPDYRLLDGAYYLLGYCHQQMGNARKARDYFAELIVKRPKSEFVPEAWLRIGEFHFERSDDPAEIALARNAYKQSMKYKGGRFYDKALYKLAWSQFRLDNFHGAIQSFKKLVAYSDRQKKKTGKAGSVLRAEAIRYIAVSLSEEDWDLDEKVDDAFVMPRVNKYLPGDKDYHREVLTQLVEYLFENNRYGRATDVIRHTLKKYPKHPKNPKLHKKLIVALLRPPKQVDEAFDERGKLGDIYGPGSDWYEYQKKEGNEEAIERGRNLVRENLIQAATWYHEQAQKLKDEGRVKHDQSKLKKARTYYQRAAKAYSQYLRRYPNDKDIYKWNFYYADALYYSGQYQKAFEQYRVVRELDLKKNEFQARAGFNAIKALEFRLKRLVRKGELPEWVVPQGAREDARQTARTQEKKTPEKSGGKADASVEPKEIPKIVERYITAMDRFVVLQLDYEKQSKNLDARFAFNAAKLYYDYKHFETARERFRWLIDNYPDKEVGYLAASLLLDTFRQEKKYQKMAKLADELEGILTGEQAKAVKQEVRRYKLGALFKSAEKLFDQKKYEKAAEKYVQLVNRKPDYKNAPLALNNAGVAYEKVGKYQSAVDIFERLYREFPDHPLAGYALYRVAVNSERFFEFDEAVSKYMLFYDKFEGRSPEELEKKMGFQVEDKRRKALISAAVLTENLGRFEQAARRYEQFVQQYPTHERAPNAQWQAVVAWKKAAEKQKMADAIRAYQKKFGSKKERASKVLEGLSWIAEWHEEKGRKEKAVEIYKEILTEFNTRGLDPGTEAASYAAEAQFQLAERDFDEWASIKIEGSLDQQKKRLQKKIKQQKKVAQSYQKVFQYKVLEWTLATGYRLGSLFQHFAEALYNVPVPFEPGSKQYNMYRTKLDEIARPLEKKAVARYEKTIKRAREEKVVNKWTKRTLEALNSYKPREYPLFKEEREGREPRLITGRPLMAAPPTTDESSQSEGASSGGGEDGGTGSEGSETGESETSSSQSQSDAASETSGGGSASSTRSSSTAGTGTAEGSTP
ncbi:MAG: tetratricopeptide repeat protein [Bradymonadaceae bacterium]